MQEQGNEKEIIQANYNGRTGAFSVQNNGACENYKDWNDLSKTLIKTYSGRNIEIRIYCWNAEQVEIDIIRKRKEELIERIVKGCKSPEREKCGSCLILCER